MEEQGQDHLIPDQNPNLSFRKRKRKRSFRIMQQVFEIEETQMSKREIDDSSDVVDCEQKNRGSMNKQVDMRSLSSSSVMERAECVQAKLKTEFPSFVKPMIRSNIAGAFWLSLPKLFCELHLPRRHYINIRLVDESHKEYYTKYLPERRGLSAGWRRFSISHNLEEGDVLVFHLVGLSIMKVYIVRANQFGEVDAALSLVRLKSHVVKK